MSGDRLALLSPIPSPSPETSAVALADPPQVQLLSTPPGIPFKVLASAYESSTEKVLRTGETPAILDDLSSGAYRVIFTPPGAAPRAATVQIPTEGAALLQQDFPHGVLKVRSQPQGAEVVCDGHQIGPAPLELPTLPGRHEVTARWNGREARTRTVQVADAAEQTVSFDFQTTTRSAKSKSRPSRKAEDESMIAKVGRSLKTFFTGESGKKR